MVLEAAEALLTKDKPLSQADAICADILRKIPQQFHRGWFRYHHLNRELKIGFIGRPGGGKSASAALTALVDFMFKGVTCWSNMHIRLDILISDTEARITTNGVLKKGGTVRYATEEFDKDAFVKFDPKYKHGLFLIDEANMELFEARRSMSNVNMYADRAIQQLRKYESSLIYTVIDEMWVDTRLRNETDIFVRCEDTALTASGLRSKKHLGEQFMWTIYDYSGKLHGLENSYHNTKQITDIKYVNFNPWQGIYDDKQLQAAGAQKYSFDVHKNNDTTNLKGLGIIPSGVVQGMNEYYGKYLIKMPQLIDNWREQDVGWVTREEVYEMLGVDYGDKTAKEYIGRALREAGFGITRARFYLPNFDNDGGNGTEAS